MPRRRACRPSRAARRAGCCCRWPPTSRRSSSTSSTRCYPSRGCKGETTTAGRTGRARALTSGASRASGAGRVPSCSATCGARSRWCGRRDACTRTPRATGS
eukprot:6394694-Prymnesium_polylepis.1